MKVSNRDKMLLMVLGVIAIAALYYMLILSPMEKKQATLTTEVALRSSERDEINLKLMSETNLDKQIASLEKKVGEATKPYYGKLDQEETLMTVFELTKGLSFRLNNTTITDITVIPQPVEGQPQLQPTNTKCLVTVDFIGGFSDLMAYLKNIETFEKKIIVRDVLVQNNFEETLTGKLSLEFNGFPQIKDYVLNNNTLVSNQFSSGQNINGLFSPFAGFSATAISQGSEDQAFIDASGGDQTVYDETETIDYESYRPKTQLYGFEDGTNFFVGNSTDITGYVSRTKTKIAGGYSTEMSFDFVTGREFSEANVVFDTNPVMLNKQADFLGLWVYSYEASNHAIGAVIIDSKGKEYRVELAPEVNWTQWQELEAAMPVEISYPCMIQRIYVEGIGYEQKLTGKYLFDKLEVSYPVQ